MLKTYVALLRGINVGGNNIINMADLKACFENMGFTDVLTYIQSGNVIFQTSKNKRADELSSEIKNELSKQFNYKANLVLTEAEDYKSIIEGCVNGFGEHQEKYRYDVLFLMPSVSVNDVLAKITLKEGVDEVFSGEQTLYFRRLKEKASQSKLTKLNTLSVFKHITVRNWNTSLKLYNLLNEKYEIQ